MWRTGSPLQISNDINPITEDRIVGVPPAGLELSLLVDENNDFLIDENNDKLMAPEA